MNTLRHRLKTCNRNELRQLSGISSQYISNILGGGQIIGSTRTLVRVADALGLSDAELGRSAREMVAPSATDLAGEP